MPSHCPSRWVRYLLRSYVLTVCTWVDAGAQRRRAKPIGPVRRMGNERNRGYYSIAPGLAGERAPFMHSPSALRTLTALLLLSSTIVLADTILYNGIRLPETWPPRDVQPTSDPLA